MAFIQDIIINITRGTKGLAEMVFRPLILGTGAEARDYVIATALADLVTAGYATDDPEYLAASAMWAQSPSPSSIAVARKASGTDWDAALTALLETYTGFWGVVITSRTEAHLIAAGDWCNANKRFFVGQIADPTYGATRNVDREAIIIHDDDAVYNDARWMGRCISLQPGSATWKWKILNGALAGDFTATQLATIRTNRTQALQEQADSIYVNEGITTSGEYVDVIMGQDWMENQLEIEILGLFIRNAKIAMDDVGIAQIEGGVRGVLKRCGDVGIVARAVSEADLLLSDDKVYMTRVTVPRRADLSVNDKATRSLTGVSFVSYLAGAIHKTIIAGLITV